MSRRTRNTDGEALSFSATMRPSKVGQPRRIDFFTLPRPVQERFAAATRRTAPPAPLLFKPAPRTTVWALLGGSGLLLLVAVLVMRAGWGDVESSVALHGVKMIVVDLLLLAGAAYGVVHAMSLIKAADTLPYLPGTYLFPGCVVEASGRTLRVWSVSDAEGFEVVSSPSFGLALVMREGGGRVVVPAGSHEEAERAEKTLIGLRPTLAKATAEDDPHMLAEMDPLHDSAMSSPIGPSERMAYSLPAWTRFDWAIAAGIGVALGLILVESRNALSDESMFRSVTAAASAGSFQAYLSQGGKHSPDVRDVLLPRIELAAAEGTGSVANVKAFAAAHVGSKIQPEIDAALRRLLLAELDKAKKVGTVAALDAFIQKYPDSGLGPELGAARHVLYQQALAAWRKKATPDAPTSAFVEKLLLAAEKAGSAACEVRFHQQTSKTLDDADQKTMKNTHYPGPDALPSHYLTTAALRQREQRVAQDLVAGFAGDFPSDVLALKAGDPIEGDADPGTPKVPTLIITYAPEWSHANTLSLRPPTIFSGINFAFDATFALPDGTSYSVKTKAWRGAELWKMKSDGMTREDFEQKVYDAMIDGAFDQLSKKLSDTYL
jgi:hypothetical protein